MSEFESYKPKIEEEIEPEKNSDGIFDPQKKLKIILEETKDLPRNVRGEKIDKFKERLNIQLENIALLSLTLENKIRKNPDISKGELNKILEDNAGRIQLSENQIDTFKENIKNYIIVHNSIKYTVDSYKEKILENDKQWKNELFKDMFGEYPKGQINLVIKPTMLYWETSKIDDYINARINGLEKSRGAKLSDKEKTGFQKSLKIGAFVIPNQLLEGLKAPVGVISSRAKKVEKLLPPFKDIINAVNTHEERHSIDASIEPDKNTEKIKEITTKFNGNTPENEIIEKIPEIVKLSNNTLLRYARSEVLAMYEPADMFIGKSKLSNTTDFILRHFIFRKAPFTLAPRNSEQLKKQIPAQVFQYVQNRTDIFKNYDYMQESINSITEIIKEKTKKDYRKIIQVEIEKQTPLFRRELLKALVSAEILGKYTKLKPKELMWLLQNEDIRNWYKLIKRTKKSIEDDFKTTYQERLKFYNL